MVARNENGKHVCTICEKRYASKSSMDGHMAKDHDGPKVSCKHPGCSGTFYDRPDMNRHYRNTHAKKSAFWCTLCLRVASDRSDNAKRHCDKVHSGEQVVVKVSAPELETLMLLTPPISDDDGEEAVEALELGLFEQPASEGMAAQQPLPAFQPLVMQPSLPSPDISPEMVAAAIGYLPAMEMQALEQQQQQLEEPLLLLLPVLHGQGWQQQEEQQQPQQDWKQERQQTLRDVEARDFGILFEPQQVGEVEYPDFVLDPHLEGGEVEVEPEHTDLNLESPSFVDQMNAWSASEFGSVFDLPDLQDVYTFDSPAI